MDCLLPGATGVDAWLARSREGACALTEPPPDRWPVPPRSLLDPTPGAPDAVTTTVGAFVADVAIDPEGLDLSGVALERLDPLFRQVLHVVRGALGGLAR